MKREMLKRNGVRSSRWKEPEITLIVAKVGSKTSHMDFTHGLLNLIARAQALHFSARLLECVGLYSSFNRLDICLASPNRFGTISRFLTCESKLLAGFQQQQNSVIC